MKHFRPSGHRKTQMPPHGILTLKSPAPEDVKRIEKVLAEVNGWDHIVSSIPPQGKVELIPYQRRRPLRHKYSH